MENKYVPDDLQNMCRLCLSTSSLVSIFDHRLQPKENMAEVIKVTTGVEISPDDEISHMLCDKCFHVTIKMFKFRRISVLNDMELKEKRAAKRKLMHKSVRTLLSKYPKLIIPTEILGNNLSPVVVLEKKLTKLLAEEFEGLPTSSTTCSEEQRQDSPCEIKDELDLTLVEAENPEPTNRKRSMSVEPPSAKKPRLDSSLAPVNEDLEPPLFTVTSVSQLNYVCDLCGAILQNNKRLKRHRSLHMRCNLCKTQFTSMTQAKEHENVCAIKEILTNLPKVLLKRCDKVTEITEKYPAAFGLLNVVEISDDEDSDSVIEVPLSLPPITQYSPKTSESAKTNDTLSPVSKDPLNSDKSRTEHLGVFSIKTSTKLTPEKQASVSNLDEHITSKVSTSKEARSKSLSGKSKTIESLVKFRRKSISGKAHPKPDKIISSVSEADACGRIIITDQSEITEAPPKTTAEEFDGKNVSKEMTIKSTTVQSRKKSTCEKSELVKGSNERLINSSVSPKESTTNKSDKILNLQTPKKIDNPDITKSTMSPGTSSQYSISDKSKEPILFTKSKTAITDTPERLDMLGVYTKKSEANQSSGKSASEKAEEIIDLIELIESGNSKRKANEVNDPRTSVSSISRIVYPPSSGCRRPFVPEKSNKTVNIYPWSAKNTSIESEAVQSASSSANKSNETSIPGKSKELTNTDNSKNISARNIFSDKSKEMSTFGFEGPVTTVKSAGVSHSGKTKTTEKPGTSFFEKSKEQTNTEKRELTPARIKVSSKTATKSVSKGTSKPVTPGGSLKSITKESKPKSISEKPKEVTTTDKSTKISTGTLLVAIPTPEKPKELTTSQKSKGISAGISETNKPKTIANSKVPSESSTNNKSTAIPTPETPRKLTTTENSKEISARISVTNKPKTIKNLKVSPESSATNESLAIPAPEKPKALTTSENSKKISAGISIYEPKTTEHSKVSVVSTNKSGPTPENPKELSTTEKSKKVSPGSSTTNRSIAIPTPEKLKGPTTTEISKGMSAGISVTNNPSITENSKFPPGSSTTKKSIAIPTPENPKAVTTTKNSEGISAGISVTNKPNTNENLKVSPGSSATHESSTIQVPEKPKVLITTEKSKENSAGISITNMPKTIEHSKEDPESSVTNKSIAIPTPEKPKESTNTEMSKVISARISAINEPKPENSKVSSGSSTNNESNSIQAPEKPKELTTTEKSQAKSAGISDKSKTIKISKVSAGMSTVKLVKLVIKKPEKFSITDEAKKTSEKIQKSKDIEKVKSSSESSTTNVTKELSSTERSNPGESSIEVLPSGESKGSDESLSTNTDKSDGMSKQNPAPEERLLMTINEVEGTNNSGASNGNKTEALVISETNRRITDTDGNSEGTSNSEKSTEIRQVPVKEKEKGETPRKKQKRKKNCDDNTSELKKLKTNEAEKECINRTVSQPKPFKPNIVLDDELEANADSDDVSCLNNLLNRLKNKKEKKVSEAQTEIPTNCKIEATKDQNYLFELRNLANYLSFSNIKVNIAYADSYSVKYTYEPSYMKKYKIKYPQKSRLLIPSDVSKERKRLVDFSASRTASDESLTKSGKSTTTSDIPKTNSGMPTTKSDIPTTKSVFPKFKLIIPKDSSNKDVHKLNPAKSDIPTTKSLSSTSEMIPKDSSNNDTLKSNPAHHQAVLMNTAKSNLVNSNNSSTSNNPTITNILNPTISSQSKTNRPKIILYPSNVAAPGPRQRCNQGLVVNPPIATSSSIKLSNNNQGLVNTSQNITWTSCNVPNNKQCLVTNSRNATSTSCNVPNNNQSLVTNSRNATSTSCNVQNNNQSLVTNCRNATSTSCNVPNNNQSLVTNCRNATSTSCNVPNNNQSLVTTSQSMSSINVQNNYQCLMENPQNITSTPNNQNLLTTSAQIDVQSNQQGLITNPQNITSSLVNVPTMQITMTQNNIQNPSEYFILNNTTMNNTTNFFNGLVPSPLYPTTNHVTQTQNQTFYNNYTGQLISFPHNVSHQVSSVAGPPRFSRVMMLNQPPAVPQQFQQMEARPSTSVRFSPMTPQIPPKATQTVTQSNPPRNEVFTVPRPPRLKRITNVKTVNSDKVTVNSQQPQCTSYIRVKNLADLT
ncbi:uncharacterized protein LOC123678626 isoform X2 [Harmonia axyridis]|uniref:uncharacterized protein LOC123678626 isoform X2 n=1 Tax=Harmonia axyridis TaxID=115357 RepID=UPI001E2752B4|nr:uncharacterized protein LOC123678626 isoform X2 [Harmonia axyridis]